MKETLYNALKSINVDDIEDSDKEELLKIFIHSDNPLIRNQIAFMFSDMNYLKAIPYVISKIEDDKLYNANGSLVYALGGMDTACYFIDLVRIVCTQDYEARLSALEIIEKDIFFVNDEMKSNALMLIEKYKKSEIKEHGSDFAENSRLNFINETEKLLRKYNSSK